MLFESYAGDGSPVWVRVTHYSPSSPGREYGPPDTWEPGHGPEISFVLVDRDGLRNRVKEASLSEEDRERIEEEALMLLGEKVSRAAATAPGLVESIERLELT